MTKPQVFVVASQKGGSGKTAICRVLSVHLSRLTHSVFLVDLDIQKTLTKWHTKRQTDEPKRVDLTINALASGIPLLAEHGADFVIIDTPPSDDEDEKAQFVLSAAFASADLVIIPIKPSPDDLESAGATVRRCRAFGVPFIFVITQAIPNTSITAQAIAALSQHGVVSPAVLVNRVAYPSAFAIGLTPEEVRAGSPAAFETGHLWESIQAHLKTRNTKQERIA